MRVLMSREVDKVRVDSRETFERLQGFARQFMPDLADRVEHYSGERPVFDLYGVEDEIQRAMLKEVPLKSGGHLIVDQTEAMTTIDVNTGSFLPAATWKSVYRTNLEAAQSVARQLRLRNLGGIIIIDFIDMTDDEAQAQVLRTLEKGLARDHARTAVYDFSPLGLVEMTLQAHHRGLERHCASPATNAAAAARCAPRDDRLRDLLARSPARCAFEASQLLVIASTGWSTRSPRSIASVAELEEFLGKGIRFQADDHYAQEQFDVGLLLYPR